MKSEADYKPWWRFDETTCRILIVLGLCSILFSIWPPLFDLMLTYAYRLLDFRAWPWWYFIEWIVVVLFSVRWFRFYAAWHEGELDAEAFRKEKRFCCVTGLLAVFMLLFTILHRLNISA